MRTSYRWSRVLVLWLTAASVFHLSARPLFAQGTVQFNNTATTQMTTNTTATPPPGQPPNQVGLTQAGYTVGLYIAPQGTTDPSQFQLLGPTTPSQSGIGVGRFNGGSSFVISNNTGQTIAFQVRAWSTFAGPTYEAAALFNGDRYIGSSAIGQVTPATNGPAPALFGTSAGQVGGILLHPRWYFRPTVSITAPAIGSLFSAPAVVSVGISANQIDGHLFGSGASLLTNDVIAGQGPLFCCYSGGFTLSNLTAGQYTLRGRVVNNDGLAGTSAPVTIRVANRPVLDFARGSNGPIQFQFNSATGINYVVESGILTNFSPVITNAGTASPISYSETNGSAAQRTYRIRLE